MSDTTTMPPSIFTTEELEDARAEMEAEREARAMEWEKARLVARKLHMKAKRALHEYAIHRVEVFLACKELVAAIDEMERLEGGAS